jgi:hypothetical protein
MFSNKDLEVVKSTLTNDVHKLIEWFSMNGMKANPEKFQAILFQPGVSKHVNFNIKLDDSVTIESSNEVKLLGVYFDENL